jgi:tetratricopeptide (TPR) repeat protein
MPVYTTAAAIVIIICSIILSLIYRRKNSRSFWVVLFIAIASLISAIAVPVLYGFISKSQETIFGLSEPVYFAAAVIVLYLAIVFVLSLVISYIAQKIMKPVAVTQSEPSGETVDGETVYADTGASSQAEQAAGPQAGSEHNGNYLEQIFEKIEFEHDREISNNEEKADKTEINFEKSVDRTEIIDKMGIENIGQTSENLGLDECIEKAFLLKESKDLESAILYYMYALDKKPGKDLAFWIVLDICVIYKELGQKEMAFDILNSYYEVYGDVMDMSVKEEIERNLQDETVEPV